MYRRTLDHVLPVGNRRRASVHFLVNMLEAYYFGDPEAVNAVLNLNPPLGPYSGDVEEIRNPKAKLKELFPQFNEIADGGRILSQLDIERVLANSATCAWLRTLFAWLVNVLEGHPHWRAVAPERDVFHLPDGVLSDVTGPQLA